MKQKKLTRLQDGFLHQMLFVGTSTLFVLLFNHVFVDFYEKKQLSADLMLIVILFASFSAVMVAFIFNKIFSKFNIVTPVTLPKVIEFSKALQDIHNNDFDSQVYFLTKKNVNIYVSKYPLLQGSEENFTVKKYTILDNKSLMTSYNGEKKLCLDFDDYQKLLEEQKQVSIPVYADKISELEKQLNILNASKLILDDKIIQITKENERLTSENEDYKKKQKTVSAREGKDRKREKEKLGLYYVAYLATKQLLENATANTKYTRPQIQEAFERELEKSPELKKSIIALLKTNKKEETNTPLSLDGWAMEVMRDALGDHIKT